MSTPDKYPPWRTRYHHIPEEECLGSAEVGLIYNCSHADESEIDTMLDTFLVKKTNLIKQDSQGQAGNINTAPFIFLL